MNRHASLHGRHWLAAAFGLLLLLGADVVFAQADVAPLLPCRGTPAPAWTTAGAPPTRQVCRQSMLHSGFAMTPGAMDSLAAQPQADGLSVAWRGSDVIGLRDWHPYGPPPVATDGLADLSTGTLVEQGSVGLPGELWWGRVAGGSYRCCSVGNPTSRSINANPLVTVNQSESLLLAVGQETMIRKAFIFTTLEQMRQIRSGQIGPWPNGSRSLHFSQLAATSVLAAGSSPVVPGSISDAALDLDPADQLTGKLRFTLQIDGQSQPVVMPVKRDVDEAAARASPVGVPGNPFRLRQARDSGDGKIADCTIDRDHCFFLDQAETQKHRMTVEPRYAVRGLFFGANGEYLAITFSAVVPYPTNSRPLWGDFRGLLILKRSQ